MEIAACPECGVPAELIDEGQVASTHGPVSMVRTRCAHRHWFLLARDHLAATGPGGGSPMIGPAGGRPVAAPAGRSPAGGLSRGGPA
jgi:hypothetical protein